MVRSTFDLIKDISDPKINLNLLNGESTTSSRTGSNARDVFSMADEGSQQLFEKMFGNVFNSMKFPTIPSPSIPTTSSTIKTSETLSKRIETVAAQYFSALSVGACLGAAIAAGLIVGTMASSTLFSTLNSFCRWCYYGPHDDSQHLLSTNKRLSAYSTPSLNDIKIIIAQANSPTQSNQSSLSNPQDQCCECLDNLAINLINQNLQWNHVRRIAVYMVTGKCTADDFRGAWRKYPHPLNDESVVFTMIYVQQLENEWETVQIETLAF